MWRLVNKSERDILLTAHKFEQGFPQFYRDASRSWTATDEEVFAFYQSCSHLYGVFDSEGLAALMYFRPITATHQEVHLDAKRGIDKDFLFEMICGVRDHRLDVKTASVETWVLRQNRSLQRMLLMARFTHTGLEMRAGKAHNKVLRWVQMVVRRS